MCVALVCEMTCYEMGWKMVLQFKRIACDLPAATAAGAGKELEIGISNPQRMIRESVRA